MKRVLWSIAAATLILTLAGCSNAVAPAQSEDRPLRPALETVLEDAEPVENETVALSAGNDQLDCLIERVAELLVNLPHRSGCDKAIFSHSIGAGFCLNRFELLVEMIYHPGIDVIQFPIPDKGPNVVVDLIHSIGSAEVTGVESNRILLRIIIPSFIPHTAQLFNCAGAVRLKIERLSLVAFVDKILQRLAGVF